MMSTTILARQAQALGQIRGYRSGSHGPSGQTATAAHRGPTIALAHQPGTPAVEVAHEVGTRLGWPLYDRELLERVARKLDVPVNVLEALDEQPQGWLLECLEVFAAPSSSVSEGRYLHHLTQVIRDLAAEGRCVIVGRGAAQFLPPRSTLRVQLVGRPEDRIAAIRDRCRLGWRAAARRVVATEQAWARFVTENFDQDPAAPQSFDLVLNTSQWSVRRCADLIAEAARCMPA